MADTLTTGKVPLRTEVAQAVMTGVQDASVLAKLGTSTPQLYQSTEHIVLFWRSVDLTGNQTSLAYVDLGDSFGAVSI